MLEVIPAVLTEEGARGEVTIDTGVDDAWKNTEPDACVCLMQSLTALFVRIK